MKRLLLLAAIGLSGCATQTLQVTPMAYSPETMEILGPARGQVTWDSYVLCLPFFGEGYFNGDESLDAINNALRPNGADALLNPAVQTEYFWAGIFCRKRVTVTGVAVKFNRPPLPGGEKPK